MYIKSLTKKFDQLQNIYGDKNLNAIYGAGKINKPELCLVFMNPTSRNVASDKKWTGLKAPWIGTKNVWKMFYSLGFINKELFTNIYSRRAWDWNYEFAQEVYQSIADKKIYITNLSKATQTDAKTLKNDIFKKYLSLFYEEINYIKPRAIITFGNQVSSICIGKTIKVSKYRKKYEILSLGHSEYKVFPIYYPVGQGMRNIDKAKEDIAWLMQDIYINK